MCTNCNQNTGVVNAKALAAVLQTLRTSGKLKEVNGEFFVPVEPEIIRETAIEFLEKQGFVTTLQVKLHLQKLKYFVRQQEVSEELGEMVDAGELLFTEVNTSGKQHRLFYGIGTPVQYAAMAYAISPVSN